MKSFLFRTDTGEIDQVQSRLVRRSNEAAGSGNDLQPCGMRRHHFHAPIRSLSGNSQRATPRALVRALRKLIHRKSLPSQATTGGQFTSSLETFVIDLTGSIESIARENLYDADDLKRKASSSLSPQARTTGNVPGRGCDHRAYPRRASGCSVSACRLDQQHNLSAHRLAWQLHSSRLNGHLVDISMNGVSFDLRQPLKTGEHLLLRISNQRFDHSIDAGGKVIRLQRNSDGGWLVVCQFDKNLSYEHVERFGKHLFRSDIV